jgi:hypothetical protein
LRSNSFGSTFSGGPGVSPVLRRLTFHDLTVTTKDENINFFLVAAGFSLRKLKLAATFKNIIYIKGWGYQNYQYERNLISPVHQI